MKKLLEKIKPTKDRAKSLREIVEGYNYPLEKHFYETKDGYINCIHRISGPKGSSTKQNFFDNQKQDAVKKPVVIYQHGLLDSSAGFCCNGKDSIPFFLADAGFDVWMNN
jgi:hypothetical protein